MYTFHFSRLPSAVYSLGKYIGILLSVLSVGAALFVCGSIGVFIPYLVLFAQVRQIVSSMHGSKSL